MFLIEAKDKKINVQQSNVLFDLQIFRVTSNLMELMCASLNFYLYCLCNVEIRLE